ncbi:hypothetical protein SAMN04515674_106157 [Pseudarcicella hirudinis]|uniref:Uncharacterized protein n=1 Tax=Pseudarcicella hirudinis TaxID=1079859 RepID=A0A1I5TQQ8_9BACT|nr:hypothetical protein [Pseudarcicella hirudinis]SFP85363.1 hypothetical protein SAMN04515674_106157 [Pseudarcicella hirudinis]
MNKHQNALQRKPGQTQQEWMSELAKIDNLNEINPEIARKLYAGGVIEKNGTIIAGGILPQPPIKLPDLLLLA